jgi:hypothetical protein
MSWRLQAQPPEQVTVIRSQHLRLPLLRTSRELRSVTPICFSRASQHARASSAGKRSGRTTLRVWFRNGAVVEYLISVHRDLSLLQSALKRIHPSIEAEIVPNRDTDRTGSRYHLFPRSRRRRAQLPRCAGWRRRPCPGTGTRVLLPGGATARDTASSRRRAACRPTSGRTDLCTGGSASIRYFDQPDSAGEPSTAPRR